MHRPAETVLAHSARLWSTTFRVGRPCNARGCSDSVVVEPRVEDSDEQLVGAPIRVGAQCATHVLHLRIAAVFACVSISS